MKFIINNRTEAQNTDVNVFVCTRLLFLAWFLCETLGQALKEEDTRKMSVKPSIKTTIKFYSLDKSTTWNAFQNSISQVSPMSFSSAPILLSACLVLVLALLQMLPLLVPHPALQFFQLLVLGILLDLAVSWMHQKWAAHWVFLDHLGHRRKQLTNWEKNKDFFLAMMKY